VLVRVNGDETAVADGASVADLLAQLGLDGRWVVVERNREPVERRHLRSTTLADGDLVDNWGEITILRSTDDVARVKEETEGKPIIIHGSATLARTLGDAGLIDRYHLLVFPVVLGAGKRMWSDTDRDKQPLRLVESEAYPNGIQKLVYEVVR